MPFHSYTGKAMCTASVPASVHYHRSFVWSASRRFRKPVIQKNSNNTRFQGLHLSKNFSISSTVKTSGSVRCSGANPAS